MSNYISTALTTIRNSLRSVIKGANFYDYRFYTNEDDFEKIVRFGKINVCVIYPLQILLPQIRAGTRARQRKSVVRIEYYYSYSGIRTSERTFVRNVETILEKLNEISQNESFIIEGDYTANTNIVMLRGVVCHQALIDITIKGEDLVLEGCKEAV